MREEEVFVGGEIGGMKIIAAAFLLFTAPSPISNSVTLPFLCRWSNEFGRTFAVAADPGEKPIYYQLTKDDGSL